MVHVLSGAQTARATCVQNYSVNVCPLMFAGSFLTIPWSYGDWMHRTETCVLFACLLGLGCDKGCGCLLFLCLFLCSLSLVSVSTSELDPERFALESDGPRALRGARTYFVYSVVSLSQRGP